MQRSKRAELFKEVLRFVDSDDWCWVDDFLIFGKEAFERYTGESTDEPCGIEELSREFVSDIRVKKGGRSVHKRISLGPLPEQATEGDLRLFISRFPPHLLKQLKEALPTAKLDRRQITGPQTDELDDRDAVLALECVRWLPDDSAKAFAT
jgi:hypothetical protein